MSPLKVAIVAGEASGDILGAGLIKALKAKYPDADFYGIGGDLMIAEGFHSRVSMEQLSVMGLVEVLGRLRSLLKLRRNLIQDLLSDPPDVFIGIDAPDFNLNIELALKRAGIPTVHYVSPSVWAWKRKRIFKIKAAVDLLLTLFPFEAKHYSETSQKLAFVGHPLAAQIAHEKTQPDPRSAFGCGANARVVALLPGSRSSEIKYLAQPFLECAQLLYNDDNNLTFILPAANQHRLSQLLTLCERFPELPIKVVLKQSREAMRAADAILIASGTATLEATLLAKPMVVAYKLSALTYAIYSRMIRTPYISLPNLLAQEALVPEIIQDDVSPQNLADKVRRALDDKEYRLFLAQRYKDIADQFDGDASERAAVAIQKLIEKSKS